MSKHLIPRGDRILVRRDAETVSAGGIHLPDQRKERPCTGVVVEVSPTVDSGSGAYRTTLVPVAKGDHVMFGQWAGVEVTVDHQELLLLNTAEVVGVIVEREGEEG